MNEAVNLDTLDDYQGQPSYRIATPAATYVFHRQGCGLASMIDPDAADWISYRPTDGPRGEYRGLPNAIHPEGGFHPGATTGQTELVEHTDRRVTLGVSAHDHAWRGEWVFEPRHAAFTMTAAPGPYWLLYEGTPGGAYDEAAAFLVDSSGTRTACDQRWERRLPDPRWVYLGMPASRFVLFLIDHGPRAEDIVDSYWSMEGAMTVLGLGRTLDATSARWRHLTETPTRLTTGFLPASDHPTIAARLNAMFSV